MSRVRIIALYLPQFHPIPENDEWWGPGFTEWTNVAKAKPLFKGHVQPKIPADLGFYDLRLAETREAQAKLAKEAGIEAFCYYHYWFGGKQLLERPFNEVVASKSPDFPFCLCWANHTWSNATWNKEGRKSAILMEQTYPEGDHEQHFYALLDAFRDERYYKIDGKLVFSVYDVWHFPAEEFITTWRRLAEKEGLPGFYFVGMTPNTLTIDTKTGERRLPNLKSSAELYQGVLDMGFDAVNSFGKRRGEMLSEGKFFSLIKKALSVTGILKVATFYDYASTVHGYFAPEDSWENVIPTVLPQWDRSPRIAAKDGIYIHTSPEFFSAHVSEAVELVKHKKQPVLFLKSWNEWAEGNYVEPDLQYGHGWLDAIRKALD